MQNLMRSAVTRLIELIERFLNEGVSRDRR
jgi:hypothetical protein